MKACELCGARYRNESSRCALDGGALRQLNDPLIGRTIAGRYILTDRIGAGGMGTVYRARHEVVGRDVAVKILAPQLAVQEAHRTRFLREARAANRINHEHIIDITDCGETTDGLVYLVMEFLDGVPLSTELREKGALPVRRALLIALQLARALGRAHDFDVVHRDIKPENIYLLRGYDGDFVKILDFGLAHTRGERRLTATGVVFGTPEFMSPEQVRGAPVTASSDLYSLGVVLFEMLSGASLFKGAAPDVAFQHIKTPPRPPSTHRRGLSPSLDMLVLRLLAKDPDDRPRSAHALADELKARLSELPNGGDALSEEAPGRRRDSMVTKVTQIGSVTLVSAWRARVTFFAELAQRAHGAHPASALTDALRRMEGTIERMATARSALASRVAEVSKQEVDAREARLRVGRALEELSNDADKVTEAMAEGERDLRDAEAALGASAEALATAWALIPPPAEGPLPAGLTLLLREAAERALDYEDAQRDLDSATRALDVLRGQHDDLEFQMAQLKGRMASLNAVTEIDLDEQRVKTSALDEQVQRELDEVVRVSSVVVEHFMQFPELRDMVRAAS